MKLFCLLLCFYIGLLGAVPCGDAKDCADTFPSSALSQDHPEHEQHSEFCAPFCICSCCSVQVVFSQAAAESKPKHPVADHYSSYTTQALQDISADIWQPPRISCINRSV